MGSAWSSAWLLLGALLSGTCDAGELPEELDSVGFILPVLHGTRHERVTLKSQGHLAPGGGTPIGVPFSYSDAGSAFQTRRRAALTSLPAPTMFALALAVAIRAFASLCALDRSRI